MLAGVRPIHAARQSLAPRLTNRTASDAQLISGATRVQASRGRLEGISNEKPYLTCQMLRLPDNEIAAVRGL